MPRFGSTRSASSGSASTEEFQSQAIAESNLNPEARSYVGAVGLMQLMPSTFGAVQTKNPELQSIDDPEWNIAAGIQYDSQLWSSWSDRGVRPRSDTVHVGGLQRRKGSSFAGAGQGTGGAAERESLVFDRDRRAESPALAAR